jgi:hypothetical protein
MESGRMTNEAPIGSSLEVEKGLEKVLLMKGGCQSVVYLQDNVKPARDKTKDRYTSLCKKGTSKKPCCPKIAAERDIYISKVICY